MTLHQSAQTTKHNNKFLRGLLRAFMHLTQFMLHGLQQFNLMVVLERERSVLDMKTSYILCRHLGGNMYLVQTAVLKI